jgi:hypothetical protein
VRKESPQQGSKVVRCTNVFIYIIT